jgi:ligand-binding sensor domain-containing protein
MSMVVAVQAQLSKPLIFTHYTKKEGLASNSISQVVQDKTGFIWLASDNGLQRYDGNKFITFKQKAGNPASIPDNLVHTLYLDKKDRLWVAGGKKIGVFDKAAFTFKEAGLGGENVFSLRKITEDDAGRILLFLRGGKMLVYNEGKNRFEPANHLPPLPEGWTHDDLVVDPATKRYWITGKAGLLLYDPATKQYSYRAHNVLNDPVIQHFGDIANTRHFHIDKQGRYWMVSWIPFKNAPELYCYDKTNNQVSTFKQSIAGFTKGYFEIWGMMQQQSGSLWLYGMQLLGLYNDATRDFRFIPNEVFRENAIQYDHITDILEDREQNIWLASNMGLYRCNPAVQHFMNVSNRRAGDTTVYKQAVTASLQTKNNGLWIATWGAGIFSYDKDLQPVANPVTAADANNKWLYVSSLLQHSNGEIWVGLQSGDLKIYDPVSAKVFSVPFTASEGNRIRQIEEDRQKNVWIITENGLLLKCVQGNWRDTARSVQVVQRLSATALRMYIDQKNNIWVCADAQGLYKIDAVSGKTLAHYTEQKKDGDGLSQEAAYDILQYNDSLYLIAARGINILNTNTNRFQYITASEGLPTDAVVSFMKDKQGNTWVTLAGGFCRLNIEKKTLVTYGVRDGITTDNFELASAAVLPDGRMVTGTFHDFLLFDPQKAAAAQTPPNVVITGFRLTNQPLRVDSLQSLKKIVLPYNKNSVDIEFSTLSFATEYKISYIMEGLDKEWQTAGKLPEAIYTYLPPGNYTFRLKAENGDGVSSKQITALQIKISPPFWNTWWFYGLIILTVAVVLYWLDRVRVEKREAMHGIRTHIAGDLHQEINTTLNNISLLSEMAKIKADKDIDRSKEYIDQIHDKSRRMIMAMDDILWSIDPANDNMEKSLLRMAEFTQALKTQYLVDIEVAVDAKVRSLHLEMKRRHGFFILYTEALRAVVEYAHSKATLVNIDFVKNKLSLKISAGTSTFDRNEEEIENCLHEMHKRATFIDADMDTRSDEHGIFIHVLVPVK